MVAIHLAEVGQFGPECAVISERPTFILASASLPLALGVKVPISLVPIIPNAQVLPMNGIVLAKPVAVTVPLWVPAM